jgi:glycerophosphoryl diester phosphodiesterase
MVDPRYWTTVTKHPFLVHEGPIPLAHRGGAGEWPENTMPAFQGAIDLGFRYLETDVHATRDGVLMAFHDSTLDRVTDRVGVINELTYTEVREAKVNGKEPIPVFEDLLQTFPTARINIDAKEDSSVRPLIAMLRRLDCLDRVCIGAFSDKRLKGIRSELGDAVCLGLGPRSVAHLRVAAIGVPIRSVPGQIAQVPVKLGPLTLVDKRFIASAHASGVDVHVWTIDDAAEMTRLLDLGVDGIMTDRPAVLKRVLQERGQWRT